MEISSEKPPKRDTKMYLKTNRTQNGSKAEKRPAADQRGTGSLLKGIDFLTDFCVDFLAIYIGKMKWNHTVDAII